MYAWDSDSNYGGITVMEERMKIMYNEHVRSPTHTVAHYISYLRRYVSQTEGQKSPPSDRSDQRTTNLAPGERADTRPIRSANPQSSDSISPLSYFIRKLKLDLKMAYPSFVEEFIQAPNNGLRLLLQLLKTIQVASLNPTGSVSRTSAGGTLKMDSYKQNMVDEQDCLLCIKYTLRIRVAVEELMDHNSGLFTVTTCLLSNFSRSRIAALEILTLIMTGPSSVDKVLDAFTSMRIKYSESTRFKMLINMMYTRGVSQVLFQVSCLRFLNTILNLSKSANMRVFLQYEMEEAGLDWKRIHEGAQGDGLEFDDLRKEIQEWKIRYIDVDTILRKIKADLRGEVTSSALLEFTYDQHFGPKFRTAGAVIEGCHGKSSPVSLWTDYTHEKKPTSELAVQRQTQTSEVTSAGHTKYEKRNSEVPNAGPIKQTRQNTSTNSGRYIARSPSPAVAEPANRRTGSPGVVNGNRESKNSKRSSVASEMYDPYGLLIKTRSSEHISSHNRIGDENWICGKPEVHSDVESTNNKFFNKNNQQRTGQKGGQQASMNSGKYDSGICVDSLDVDPDDRIAVGLIKKSSRPITMSHSPVTGKGYIDVGVFGGARPTKFKVDKTDSDSDNGLRSWYNPIPISSRASSEPGEQNLQNDYKNGKLSKPRTPSPDYEDDSWQDADRPFSPKQSSTMKATLKAKASRILNQDLNVQHVNSNTSVRNLHFGTTREGGMCNSHSCQQDSNFAQSPFDSRGSSSKLVSDKQQTGKIRENRHGFHDQSASRLQSQRSKHTTQRMSDSAESTSADSDSRYQLKRHDGAPSPPRIQSDSTDHPSNDNRISMGFNGPRYSRQVTSEEQTHQRDISHPKSSIRGPVQHMSGSLISLGVSDIETGKFRNTGQLKSSSTHNHNGSRTSSRRSSVIDQKPVQDSVRRNSLIIVTSFTDTNTQIQDRSTKGSNSSGVDSMRSYSAEIGRVLSDLDLALEKHGWQATLKGNQKQAHPPLIAYI